MAALPEDRRIGAVGPYTDYSGGSQRVAGLDLSQDHDGRLVARWYVQHIAELQLVQSLRGS